MVKDNNLEAIRRRIIDTVKGLSEASLAQLAQQVAELERMEAVIERWRLKLGKSLADTDVVYYEELRRLAEDLGIHVRVATKGWMDIVIPPRPGVNRVKREIEESKTKSASVARVREVAQDSPEGSMRTLLYVWLSILQP